MAGVEVNLAGGERFEAADADEVRLGAAGIREVAVDTVGKRSFTDSKKVLKDDGVFLAAVMDLPLLFHMIWSKITGGKKAKVSATGLLPVKERLNYFIELKEMLRTSKIKTVIDVIYPLAQVSAAHAYVETGHKRGSIIIAV